MPKITGTVTTNAILSVIAVIVISAEILVTPSKSADFKTINANGAGDTTAAYIAAFGVEDLIPNIKKACAAGAIVAGTNDEPTIEKIEEIAELVEVNPR